MIVAVSVNADITVPLQCKLHDCMQNTVYLAVAGNPMNSSIGFVIEPCTAVYLRIRRIVASPQEERGYHLSTLKAHITVLTLYVATEECIAWVTVCPLAGVTRSRHEPTGICEYLLHLRNIGYYGMADSH